jgi:serine/threonine protein kinase
MGEQQSDFANRFRILSLKKTGGTASVYQAFDLTDNRLVALKVFSEANRDSAVVAEIWNRECAALTKLSHPSIVGFVDAGRSEGTSERYIALEWIDGLTLEEHLDQAGKLSWEEFYDKIGRMLVEVLTFAAERNVAHRDLSTGNVLLTPGGVIKVIDFGQAKLESVGIGLTVAGWKTVPYCLPEDDTGTHTYTRDPYAISAIAIRALSGRKLANHEELYAALEQVQLPDRQARVIRSALSRTPSDRFKTIIEFAAALNGDAHIEEGRVWPAIAFRISPGIVDEILPISDRQEDGRSIEEVILSELNDVVAVSEDDRSDGAAALLFETQSYRIVVSPDPVTRDHLVASKVIRKRFRLDAIFQSKNWIPQQQFTNQLPRSVTDRDLARRNLQRFYQGLEAHLDEVSLADRRDGLGAVAAWGRLIEALRFIARTGIPPLRYSRLTREGTRLTATVENIQDAEEEELRVITAENTWVFRGEIETIRENKCVLVSTRPHFDFDRLPAAGTLDIDWQQTRVALDRQARAIDKFKANEIPSARLQALIIGTETGPDEESFAPVEKFFDQSLDEAKRIIVSRFVAGADLLVTHGPPGTGKTKVIVELILQALKANPEARILLASQTHVALDNALERLLSAQKDISCVRIGSGSKEADARVASTSLDQRSEALKEHVAQSAQLFLEERAAALGIDQQLVALGLAALDLMGAKMELERADERLLELDSDIAALQEEISEEGFSTSDRSEKAARAKVLEDDRGGVASDRLSLIASVGASRQKLSSLGADGAELASQTIDQLRDWSELLLSDESYRAMGELMRMAEHWKLRFGNSDDFKAAIILSSSIVAGTCVGFCREEAALRTTFDLCIIDEAGKATTTELLVPLAQSRRAVLFGDHHQLPAVLDHAIKAQDIMERFSLSQQQLSEQLFEKLNKDLKAGCKAGLDVQYRMRGEIGRLVSECFYDGVLKEDESLKSRILPDLSFAGIEKAVTWLDPYPTTSQAFHEQRRGTSFENAREAQTILALLKMLLFVFTRGAVPKSMPTIAVISGYAPQVSLIRNLIRREPTLDALTVECASVHAFQGREVDICIYSITRHNERHQIGMLKDWRHLNVALSRAKNFLVIVGGLEFCRSVDGENPFGRIIDFVEGSADCAVKEWTDA